MTTIKNAFTDLKQAKLNLLIVVGLLVGVAIGFPLGNHTVTKHVVHTKTVTKNVSAQLSIGESETTVINALNLQPGKTLNGGTKKVGKVTFNCVVYYGHRNAKGNPTDWYATFCGV